MKAMHPLCIQFDKHIKNAEFEDAVMTANQLTEINPRSDAAYYLLGYALKLCQQFRSALKCFDQSIQLNSIQTQAYTEKGEIHYFLGEQEQAFSAFTSALEWGSEDPIVLQKTGGFLLDNGHLTESKIMLDKALKLGNELVLEELLDWHERNSDKKLLLSFIEQHTDYWSKNEDNLSLANAYLSLKDYEKTAFYLKSMSIDKKPKLWQRAYFNLLAQAYEKLRLYDKAFESYSAQNKRTELSYNPKKMEQNFQTAIHLSEKISMAEKMETIAIRTRWKPVFIIGLPRTGSTLLENILATSKHFLPAGELEFIETAFNDYSSQSKTLTEVSIWIQSKLDFIVKEQGLSQTIPLWVSDKMPTNFVYIGFIKAMLPDAKFLYCKRHPMDVGLSIYKQNFNQAIGYANDLDHIAHFMALENNIMEHWLSEYSDSILSVEYEHLVSDFNHETQQIFEFLNLKWSSQVNQFYKNKRFAKTASYQQVREPIKTQWVAQYTHYLPQLKDFYQQLRRYKLVSEQEEIKQMEG